MEEKKVMGMDYVSQEEVQIAIKVAYVREFHSPDECDCQSIVTTLKARLGVSRQLIHRVFQKCRDGVANPEKQKRGPVASTGLMPIIKARLLALLY
jgi:hypothetical protein